MTLRLETSASYGVSSGEEASVIHLNEGQMMDSFDVLEFPEIGAEESSSPHPRLEMPEGLCTYPEPCITPHPLLRESKDRNCGRNRPASASRNLPLFDATLTRPYSSYRGAKLASFQREQ